jgi:multidrug resistance efflux pump
MARSLLLACALLASSALAAPPVTLDGEVHATSTAPILPPSVDTIWQFTITRLTADGAPVKEGEVVVAFDGGQLTQDLLQKQSTLKEKTTQRDNLLLDLAERQRQERLATEERRAAVDKAARKATQPAELIGRNDYGKLVVERRQAERQLALAERREALAAEQRRQEQRLLDSEIAQLQAEVAELQRSLAALEVRAPRDGVMVHRSSFNGEKFDVGSQVWRGLAVAEIPDLGTLAVRATLAERDLSRIVPGQPVRVTIEGGAGAALRGRVAEIGRTVRSKSRVQPIPVVDVGVQFERVPEGLKPGQPVRVELLDEAMATKGTAP